MHPHDVEFWIRAAMHELNEVGSADGARSAYFAHTCGCSSCSPVSMSCAVLDVSSFLPQC